MPKPEPVPLPGHAGRAPAVRAMFDSIAGRYDRLNRILSFRLDLWWRRRLVDALELEPSARVLDLCAGTMDVAALVRERGGEVVGVDSSRRMLDRGRAKTGLPAVLGDALALPFAPGSFDAVTVAFGLRNLESQGASFREIARVLRPGGSVGILELFRPEARAARLLHAAWVRHVVPAVGATLAGAPSAYRYLAESVEAFGTVAQCEAELRAAGFSGIERRRLWPGLASIVLARRPS